MRGRAGLSGECLFAFLRAGPACSRRAGSRLREFPLRLGRLARKIPATKLIHADNF